MGMYSNWSGNLTDIQVIKVRVLACPLKKPELEIEIKSSTLFRSTIGPLGEIGRHGWLRTSCLGVQVRVL